jgi:hypothetical protein
MEYFRAILVFGFAWGLFWTARADVMPVSFSGSGASSFDGWANMTSANLFGYGGFPGISSWPGPIGSNVILSEDAELLRLAGSPTGGGPFPSSGSIYFGNFDQITNALGGTLAVKDTRPLAGVRTIVLQVQIGEVLGYDFHHPSGYPILRVNNSSELTQTTFTPVLVNRYQNGTFESPETGDEPLYINTWAFQWNLAEGVEVSSFQIEFSAVTHAQVYALQLNQSSTLQSQQIFDSNEPQPPPPIRLVAVGIPEFSGLQTFMTHTFAGPAGKTIDLEYSPDLAPGNWVVKSGISTGDGTFLVTFTANGDQRGSWSQRMFFRAKHSAN